MKHLSCLLALLLLTARPLPAQTRPAAPRPVPAANPALASCLARLDQYFADYQQRLSAAYFAPSDARATALLSTATEELAARRKGLRQELTQLRPRLNAAERQQLLAHLRDTTGQAARQRLLSSPAAAKLADRMRRNPALETAFQRFTDARLDVVEAPAAP